MSVRPKINLYLVHQETGQRYPVGEEVIIGRSSGDLLFNDDSKMSSQHCRIWRTPKGLGLHDLGSSNGTYVDGIRLNPEKVYIFKPGSVLTTGLQVFKLQELNLTKKPARRRKVKKKQQGLDLLSVMATILAVGSILFFAHLFMKSKGKRENVKAIEIVSPFTIVENEMKSAFAEYAEIGRAHTAQEISDQALANGIRKNLVPRLTAAYEKLGVLKPTSEFERRKIKVNRKLVFAIIEQVKTMASYAETKNQKFAKDLERLSALAAIANEEAQKLEASRSPANYDY